MTKSSERHKKMESTWNSTTTLPVITMSDSTIQTNLGLCEGQDYTVQTQQKMESYKLCIMYTTTLQLEKQHKLSKLYLLNNEQMIQKLADSKPVRRAAQLTVFVSQKAKESGFDSVSKFSEGFKQGETNASKPVRRRK